jgi:hypothetical protein
MGGWAAKPNIFKLPLGAIPYTPDPDIGTASGYRTPGGGVRLRFYEQILKIDREIRNLISTIATCWSGGRGYQTGTSALGGSNKPASQLGDLKREGKEPEGDPAVPYCIVLCCTILSHKRARDYNRFMRCETAHVDLILCL